MRIIFCLSILMLCISCGQKKHNSDEKPAVTTSNEVTTPEFQTILDTANVKGAILIFDLEKDKFYSNDFEWSNQGHLPASTFKITNSIIALETGVVEDDRTLFKWDGKKRMLKSWEQDLILKDAFHFSCVPCYQEVARKIGPDKMNEYLNKFDYGDMVVDTSNIDMFWLEGDSRISQFQQISFLKKLYHAELPITQRTDTIMRRMMVMEETADYKLSGKTGWSSSTGVNNGWFVGFIETKNNVYFFATNIEPGDGFDMKRFADIRKEVTFEALKHMGIDR